MSEGVPTVTDESWEEQVVAATGTVLVDFWASWCPPCRQLTPEIEALARSLAGQIVVAKLDVDASPGIASRYGVRSIPTLVLFERGLEADRRVGFASAEELRNWVVRRKPLADGERSWSVEGRSRE